MKTDRQEYSEERRSVIRSLRFLAEFNAYPSAQAPGCCSSSSRSSRSASRDP